MTNLFQDIEKYFNELSFEETSHKYSVGKTKIKLSATGVIEKFKSTFDALTISGYVADSRGISQDEVLKEWKDINTEAIQRGNRVHLFGELYPRNRNMTPTCPQEEAIVKFWKDLPSHLEIVKLELPMYHKQFMFAGTADITLYNKNTGTFIILDYKTNKDLFKNFKGQKLYEPFEDLLDQPFNHYQIQLSLYQLLLEQTGAKVSSRKIIWLKRDGNYEMYDTEDFRPELKHFLENNKL